MKHPKKYVWVLRALIYKLFLGKVGNMAYIGKPLFIEGRKNILIGVKVRIFPGLRIQTLGEGKIEIGNNVAIEQNCHIIAMDNTLKIGNDTTISANTFITNCDHDYSDITKSVMDQRCIVKKTEIGEGCFLGLGCVILAGTRLGKHCVVGANATVRGEFPDYSVIVGVPGRMVKRYEAEQGKWMKVDDKNNFS